MVSSKSLPPRRQYRPATRPSILVSSKWTPRLNYRFTWLLPRPFGVAARSACPACSTCLLVQRRIQALRMHNCPIERPPSWCRISRGSVRCCRRITIPINCICCVKSELDALIHQSILVCHLFTYVVRWLSQCPLNCGTSLDHLTLPPICPLSPIGDFHLAVPWNIRHQQPWQVFDPTMAENDEALSHPEYWDERYSKSDGETPTHEWFRSFSDLGEFFQKVLFQSPGRKPEDNPLILHLGSGDSVRYSRPPPRNEPPVERSYR